MEQLDQLFVNPESEAVAVLLDRITKVAASGRVGTPRPGDEFRAGMEEAKNHCVDMQLFYALAMCAAIPQCEAELLAYNDNHPRTSIFVEAVRQAFACLIRAMRLPGDAVVASSSGGGDTEVTTVVEFSARMRLHYFTIRV